MTIVYPESTPSLGAIKVVAVESIANMAAPDLSTEIGAGTSVDLSCALMAEGWTPTTSQGKSNRKRRLCSTSDTPQLDPAVNSIGTILYSVGDPQNPEASIDTLMVEGAVLYFVEGPNVDADSAFTAGDKVLVHHLRLGKPYLIRDSGQDNGEFHKGVEAVYVNDGPVEGTIVA